MEDAHLETVLDNELDDESPVGPTARAFLVVSGPNRPPETIELALGARLTIGRSPECDIAVDDARASRLHARLERTNEGVRVVDLGGRNGTRVRGVHLRGQSRPLAAGDAVRIGSTVLTLASSTLRTSASEEGVEGLVVADPEMRRLFAVLRKLAAMPTTVLILGETGVGKEVFAERLHAWSDRARGSFVRVNCAALPHALLESELFGYERGAFTGADRRKIGLIEAANGGTLFLDEVGETSAQTQAKMLVTLEKRVVTRLGSTDEIPVDVRLVSATNRDLERAIAEGTFREDLFYRLSAFTLSVPPLRERPVEILALAQAFLFEAAQRAKVPAPAMSREVRAILARHGWPGNVRELRNAMEHAFVLADKGAVRPEHLPIQVTNATRLPEKGPLDSLRDQYDSMERKSLVAALDAERWNQTRAARRLGITRRALIYRMAKHGLGRANEGEDER